VGGCDGKYDVIEMRERERGRRERAGCVIIEEKREKK
jgi:hypothetical protein